MCKLAFVALIAAAHLLDVFGELAIKEKKMRCERLSNAVVPTKYSLEFQFPSFEEQTFHGQVNISLRFPDKKSESSSADYDQLIKGLKDETCWFGSLSDKIILHADPNIELLDVDVIAEPSGWNFLGGKKDKNRPVVGIERDKRRQLIEIKLDAGLRVGGVGQLSIKFRSRFSEGKRGVYVSTFNDGTKTYKHVVSQFQPTDARTVFPVFDEPRFKVPFQVRLIHPTGLTALSNTDVELAEPAGDIPLYTADQLTRTTFKQTPPMSVHMVAFTVGQFDEPLEVVSKSTIGDHHYRVRVFTEPGKRESGHFALEVAQRSLGHFERYINFEFPLEKFDIVAIADHDKDNTESWGLSFIRDSLVWIDDETKPDTKITTAINVVHVCVHQWFGNLVTAAWWNDLWITEGVAGQFTFNIVRELYPHFQSEYFVRLATLSGAMQLDARGKFHALKPKHNDLRTSDNIYALFSNIEVMKGAALAQMISKWMGTKRADWYREFLQLLVSAFAYKSVNRKDYVIAMKNTIGKDFGDDEYERLSNMFSLMDSFNSKHGVPLINANLENDRLTFDVELMPSARRHIAAEVEKQPRPVMVYDNVRIAYRDIDNNEFKRDHLPHSIGFSSERGWALNDSDIIWVKVSSAPDIHTYHRTRYSDNLYGALKDQISARKLSAMDRLQVLNDANVLAQAHLIKGDTFKQLVDCYADEDNGAVLLELMVALKTLDSRQLSSPSSKAVFNIFEKYGYAVDGEETFLEQRSRSVALRALIMQGNQQVIGAAIKAFDEVHGNVAPFLREPVYIAVALGGLTEQLKQLEAKLQVTKSYEEKIRLAGALSMSEDKEVLHNLWLWLDRSSGLKEAITQPLIDTIKSKL